MSPIRSRFARGNLRFKQAREEALLSQLDVAHLAGCSEHLVSKIETGRLVPGTALKRRLAEVLHAPAEHMFTEESP